MYVSNKATRTQRELLTVTWSGEQAKVGGSRRYIALAQFESVNSKARAFQAGSLLVASPSPYGLYSSLCVQLSASPSVHFSV